MRKITKEILMVITGTFLMAGGFGLIANFTNALLLIGLGLITVGISILFILVVAK